MGKVSDTYTMNNTVNATRRGGTRILIDDDLFLRLEAVDQVEEALKLIEYVRRRAFPAEPT